ncbi:unnamed protein product [Rhodiola kirilowii]
MDNFLCWNARGVTNKDMSDYLRLIVYNNKVELCVILEPKSGHEGLNQLARRLGFTSHLHGGNINKHVWIMWKDSFIAEDIGMSGQHITVKIKHVSSEGELVCSFVYASMDRTTRTQPTSART